MPRKMPQLPRQTIQVDDRGRITIPDYLRKAAKIKNDGWVTVHAEPNLKECKGLLLIAEKF